MPDRIQSDAEKVLRDIKREFAFAFRGKSKDEVPDLVLRIADCPQTVSPVSSKEMTISPAVFAALRNVVAQPEALRVMSFDHRTLPWFDLVFETNEHSLTFRIGTLHSIRDPIRELKSAV